MKKKCSIVGIEIELGINVWFLVIVCGKKVWVRSIYYFIVFFSLVFLIVDVLKIWYLCVVMDVRSRVLVILLGVIVFLMFCLLVNIINIVFFSLFFWKKKYLIKMNNINLFLEVFDYRENNYKSY